MKKSKDYDWRHRKVKGFPYKSTEDPKYLKDRSELFEKSGNGWWWGQPKPEEETKDD